MFATAAIGLSALLFGPGSPLHPAALFLLPLLALLVHRCLDWRFALAVLLVCLASQAMQGIALTMVSALGLVSLLVMLAFEGHKQRARLATRLERALEQIDALELEVAGAGRRHAELARTIHGREELLSLVSHDLRSALNAMVGWLYLARSERATDQTRARSLDGIASAVTTQRRLVEQLLDASRLLSGTVRPESIAVDIDGLMTRMRVRFEVRARSRGIDLQVEPAAGRLAFNADPARVEESLATLIEQALLVAPDNSWVRVHARHCGGDAAPMVMLAVEGSGSALARDDLDQVLTGAINRSTSPAGPRSTLGLPMAIARAVTELQGGVLEIESASPAPATRLSLRFPAAADAAPQATFAAATAMQTAITVHRSPVDDPETDESGLSGDPLHGASILLVDDRRDMLDVTATLLRGCGAQVTTASSGQAAIAAYSDWAGGGGERLLLSDLSMPQLDGLGMIRQIRQLEREQGLPRIPAVAFSAQSDLYPRRSVLEAGFDLFLAKPIAPRALIAAILPLTGR